MKTIKILAFVSIFLSACTKESEEVSTGSSVVSNSTSDMQAVKAPNARPFTAQLYTTVDANPAHPPTACTGDLPGLANPGVFLHGNASHMGALNSQLSRIQDVSCNLSVNTMLLTTSFTGQLVAANGDVIYISGDDIIDASNFIQQISYAGTIVGTWIINGGTGRFAGATGSFTISGPVDFATTSFSCTCQGTITY